jgi:hypothetical protein
VVCFIEDLEVFLFQLAHGVALRVADRHRIHVDYDFGDFELWRGSIRLSCGQGQGKKQATAYSGERRNES